MLKLRFYKVLWRLRFISHEQYFNKLVEIHEHLKMEYHREIIKHKNISDND